jgi:hypothetical protein
MKQRDYPFLRGKKTAKRAVDNSLGLRRTATCRRSLCAGSSSNRFVATVTCYTRRFPTITSQINLVFDKASKIVAEPRLIAFQGVSTSSFGFTLLN